MYAASAAPADKAMLVLEAMGIQEAPALHLDDITANQDIRVKRQPLPNDSRFSGALLFRGEKRGILINTHIDNPGHNNFTLAHELGHHFLEHMPTLYSDGRNGFLCDSNDLDDAKSVRKQEVEANIFARELLMPEQMFRIIMAGSVLDFTLISGLAIHFLVSKHASAFRILDFIREPYIVILSQGLTITSVKCSAAARRFRINDSTIPPETMAYRIITESVWQTGFTQTDTRRWLQSATTSVQLYECTRGTGEVAMTILKLQ